MSLQRLPSKKSRPALLLGLLAGVVVLMVCMSKCSRPAVQPAQLHPELRKSSGDTLDVAIEISPLSYKPAGDSITGLDYEIMTSICADAGRPVKFHAFAPLEYAVKGLNDGLFDVIVSSLPSTAALKDRFSLTDEVYRDRQVLVQRRDDKRFVDSPDMLGGDTVWVAAGSPFTQRIANLSAENGDTIHVLEEEGRTAEHLVMLVARGEIPRAVVYGSMAATMQRDTYPDIDCSTPVGFTQFQSWALAKDNIALTDSLNVWLGRFRETDAYRQLLRKYGLLVGL